MNDSAKLLSASITGCLLAMTLASGSRADRIDPSLIPPDVTLRTGGGSSAAAAGSSSTPTPGINPAGASAAAAAPAQAAPAAAPQAPAHVAGQPLPPGAIATPPPPPTGSGAAPPPSGSFDRPGVNQAANYAMFQTNPQSGPNAAPDVSHDPIAVIETPKGTITFRLFKSLAPKTVANFEELAAKGFFNGLTFHRVEPNFCIQGGDPLGNGFGMYTDPTTKQPRFLPLEIATGLKHNAPGVVAMAHGQSPNSASCQFYITLSPQPSLDGKYAIFGGVISGMDVARSIAKGDKMTTVSVQMP